MLNKWWICRLGHSLLAVFMPVIWKRIISRAFFHKCWLDSWVQLVFSFFCSKGIAKNVRHLDCQQVIIKCCVANPALWSVNYMYNSKILQLFLVSGVTSYCPWCHKYILPQVLVCRSVCAWVWGTQNTAALVNLTWLCEELSCGQTVPREPHKYITHFSLMTYYRQ